MIFFLTKNIVIWPFLSSSGPLYLDEVKCSAFDKKMTFHSHANKTHFHKKCWALGLILKVRVLGTRKFWLIRFRKFKVFKYEPRLLITWNSCLCNESVNCILVSYKFVDGRIELNTNLTKSTNKQTRITGYKIGVKRGILGVMPFLLIKCRLHLSL